MSIRYFTCTLLLFYYYYLFPTFKIVWGESESGKCRSSNQKRVLLKAGPRPSSRPAAQRPAAKKCRGGMVRRRTYRNKAWKDLVKAVVVPEEQQFPCVFIQYRFEGEPCSFDLLPHGNSKGSQSPYVRVNPSTVQLLKEESDAVTSAKKAYHNVEKKVGGLTGVSTVSQLPRNAKQVYNAKTRRPQSMPGSSREDSIYRSLNSMEMEEGGKGFLRDA